PSRADNRIFGRPLLERLILSCERAGVKRFFIAAPAERHSQVASSLGGFRSRLEVNLVDKLDSSMARHTDLDPDAPCISFAGNLVFSKLQLRRVLDDAANHPSRVLRFSSSDPDRGGEIATGPMRDLLEQDTPRMEPARRPTGELPFALNGRPEDREEAELRLARSQITPNQVTIANTILGFVAAWMFAIPSYGWRLLASLLFLASITIDGIDGELARLQMSETDWGGKLDLTTDNIVHVAIFIGIYVGAYRASANSAFLWLLPIQLAGFALCVLSIYLAFRLRGAQAQKWINQVDRWSGRDFAYLLVGFALISRLQWFCWGTAFGTYVYASVLTWLAARHRAVESPDEPLRKNRSVAVEEA